MSGLEDGDFNIKRIIKIINTFKYKLQPVHLSLRMQRVLLLKSAQSARSQSSQTHIF